MSGKNTRLILWFEELTKEDVPIVGGKNANLGEMIRAGIPVPPGFAVTAYAYKRFIEEKGIKDKIYEIIRKHVPQGAAKPEDYMEASQEIRKLIESTPMPKDIEEEIRKAYRELSKRVGKTEEFVAVRSSATAEDLPDASFAGQQETYLNVKGEDDVVEKVRKCWSSLFTPRAIFYRESKGFEHERVLISVAVQKMVNSRSAGVMFTLHPVTGDRNKIVIEGHWGLGESVVSGKVTPDEWVVDKKSMQIVERNIVEKRVELVRDPKTGKNIEREIEPERRNAPSLTDEEVLRLAELAVKIEQHYGRPMDIEWAVDRDLKFPESVFIVQARPETVWSTRQQTGAETTSVKSVTEAKPVVKGLAASPGVAFGKAKICLTLEDAKTKMQPGDILVTKMTDPDWVPYMKIAAAIVTDEGGMTAHAAIVSRELGIPAIVGTREATKVMVDGKEYTVDAKTGVVYEGRVEELLGKKEEKAAAAAAAPIEIIYKPITGTKIYMNLGVPEKIKEYKNLPFDGIGLMRVEFIMASYVGEHPLYLLESGRGDVLVNKMAEGIALVAREIYPRPVVVRFSDFKTNEYRQLKGGEKYEPQEDNPMLGWRGVSRYISPQYEKAFRLEVRAIKKVREEMGLGNVWVMAPFVRTLWEAERFVKLLAEEGLESNRDFKVWAMAEVPSIIFLAEEFSRYFDGFSIGSNDLTQLTLGTDRDSAILPKIDPRYFDERDPAVRTAIAMLIEKAHKSPYGYRTVSICGQAPSVYPEFSEFLVRHGIDSISVNPDVVMQTRELVAQIEHRILLEKTLGIERVEEDLGWPVRREKPKLPRFARRVDELE
ncbi:MAG: phosphoenolpyruvate synthase [Infirmifilum sp.]|jgi:pyruvate,water dikinase|uniref:Phosphoenolpyruvate synthase n=1 Tax=Infirmifilum uzonense TaxID=1550241 RepID=A0A0F7FHZ9_9CREN|nr:phosphoenolpyruvate synthase [Infirmifilum uzonense]AKG38989.1 phosphoenolpyruvate synthase [Infirmifilum uzonense]